jgi:dihydrofolate synthase/folylpolyglutamate synthase
VGNHLKPPLSNNQDFEPAYEAVVERLESVRDVPAREQSFERYRRALNSLNLGFQRENTILVAGTNGKGSVAKTLEVLLSQSGRRVGLFTSPHMMSTTERIRSQGRDLSQAEFVGAYRLVQAAVERESLSHFEAVTLMMNEVFFGGRIREPVTHAVIEVGVGGRLDPTRLTPHRTSVITRLGLDHMDLLGPDLVAIAREKSAVTEEHGLAVFAPIEDAGVRAVITERERLVPGRYVEAVNFPFHVVDKNGSRGPVWVIETPWGQAPLALRGQRAADNTSLALTVLHELGENVRELLPALSQVHWPCRMEQFLISGKRVFLSGDHNPQGVASLADITSAFQFERLHLLVGIAKNKPLIEMAEAFLRLKPATVHLTQTPFRGGAIDQYISWPERSGATVTADPIQALKAVLRLSSERDLVLLSGSLYLAGFIRKQIIAGKFGPAEPLDEYETL